ncbi:MAG: hypothetical protein V3S69_03430 [Dehalococcoidales bacterium]
MKHAREDYNRFQDPLNKIPEDEPVMLFRAQDKYAVAALSGYVKAILEDPEATEEAAEVYEVVNNFIAEFKDWHTKKSPDLDKAL